MDRVTVRALRVESSKVKDDVLLIGFFKDKVGLSGEIKKFDNKLNNIISSYIKNNDFKGEKGETRSIFVNRNVKNIVLVGLGEENKFSFDVLSNVASDASKRLRDNGTDSFSFFLDSFKN